MTSPKISLAALRALPRYEFSRGETSQRNEALFQVGKADSFSARSVQLPAALVDTLIAQNEALPALLAIAEAAIEDRAAQEAVNRACLDDMDSEEAQAAFQRGHDADKALAAALALVEG